YTLAGGVTQRPNRVTVRETANEPARKTGSESSTSFCESLADGSASRGAVLAGRECVQPESDDRALAHNVERSSTHSTKEVSGRDGDTEEGRRDRGGALRFARVLFVEESVELGVQFGVAPCCRGGLVGVHGWSVVVPELG